MAATIKQVADYLKLQAGTTATGESYPNETLKDFTEQWKQLTDEEKAQLRDGIGDGSFSY